MYIYSTNGTEAIGFLRTELPEELRDKDKATRMAAGWYDFVATTPTVTDEQYVTTIGFKRNGDDFTGVYAIREKPQVDATEADKDAALSRLGVDMTEA